MTFTSGMFGLPEIDSTNSSAEQEELMKVGVAN